jgi:hypothetical protein
LCNENETRYPGCPCAHIQYLFAWYIISWFQEIVHTIPTVLHTIYQILKLIYMGILSRHANRNVSYYCSNHRDLLQEDCTNMQRSSQSYIFSFCVTQTVIQIWNRNFGKGNPTWIWRNNINIWVMGKR